MLLEGRPGEQKKNHPDWGEPCKKKKKKKKRGGEGGNAGNLLVAEAASLKRTMAHRVGKERHASKIVCLDRAKEGNPQPPPLPTEDGEYVIDTQKGGQVSTQLLHEHDHGN
jgi:hypothetical protein